jgi:hypothetical protein
VLLAGAPAMTRPQFAQSRRRPIVGTSLTVAAPTAIQALDRLDPVLPLSPGRAERQGFEYYRHGTLSLLAALDTQSGEVLGQTVARHTSAAFVEFLGDIVATQPKRREIHVIATICRRTRPKPCAPFSSRTRTYICISRRPTRPGSIKSNSGLRRSNAICSRGGIFTSVADLARKIRRYIRHYNKTPKPIRWSYRNPAHRISSTSVSTVH